MEFWANFVNKFNTAFVEGNRWKLYLQGLGYTVELTVIALIIGIILGVVVLRLIFVALTMLGVDSSSLFIIKGAIILCACALDMRKYLVKK